MLLADIKDSRQRIAHGKVHVKKIFLSLTNNTDMAENSRYRVYLYIYSHVPRLACVTEGIKEAFEFVAHLCISS